MWFKDYQTGSATITNDELNKWATKTNGWNKSLWCIRNQELFLKTVPKALASLKYKYYSRLVSCSTIQIQILHISQETKQCKKKFTWLHKSSP